MKLVFSLNPGSNLPRGVSDVCTGNNSSGIRETLFQTYSHFMENENNRSLIFPKISKIASEDRNVGCDILLSRVKKHCLPIHISITLETFQK